MEGTNQHVLKGLWKGFRLSVWECVKEHPNSMRKGEWGWAFYADLRHDPSGNWVDHNFKYETSFKDRALAEKSALDWLAGFSKTFTRERESSIPQRLRT